MQVKATDLAWAAGILDGEGYLGLYRVRPKTLHNLSGTAMHIEVAMTHEATLLRLQQILGGRINGPYTRPNRLTHWKWYTAGQKHVAETIRALRPYLTTKRQDAALLLRFVHWRWQQPAIGHYQHLVFPAWVVDHLDSSKKTKGGTSRWKS